VAASGVSGLAAAVTLGGDISLKRAAAGMAKMAAGKLISNNGAERKRGISGKSSAAHRRVRLKRPQASALAAK